MHSMGECSFGNGFGQTNKNKKLDIDFDESIWKRIPTSIFTGMTRRYQVRNSYFYEWMRWLMEQVRLHQTLSKELGGKP